MEHLKVIQSLVYNLFKNGVESFLTSQPYKFLCKENHVRHFNDYKRRAINQKDYRESSELLIEMLNELYSKDKLSFDQFTIEFFKGFKDFHGPIFELDKIIEYLEQLDVPTAEVEALAYPPKSNLVVNKEGIFFQGQTYDALKMFSSIFKNAKNSVIIIDRYVDEGILEYFEGKDNKLTLKILTEKNLNMLKKLGNAFNKQHGGLEIRESGKFHDRFIIIDEKDFYHIGSSITDEIKRCFMFSRIAEKVLTDCLLDYFCDEWKNSKIII